MLNGSPRAAAWLLERGADRDALNDDGLSPLALAARHGLWASFDRLRRRAHETTAWACGRVRRVHDDYSHVDSTRKCAMRTARNARNARNARARALKL